MKVLYDNNSHEVSLNELADADGVYVNDAAVECVMFDADGVEVVGETWPLAMAHDGGTNGTYTADVAPTLDITPGDIVTIQITATKDALVGVWRCQARVRERGC